MPFLPVPCNPLALLPAPAIDQISSVHKRLTVSLADGGPGLLLSPLNIHIQRVLWLWLPNKVVLEAHTPLGFKPVYVIKLQLEGFLGGGGGGGWGAHLKLRSCCGHLLLHNVKTGLPASW